MFGCQIVVETSCQVLVISASRRILFAGWIAPTKGMISDGRSSAPARPLDIIRRAEIVAAACRLGIDMDKVMLAVACCTHRVQCIHLCSQTQFYIRTSKWCCPSSIKPHTQPSNTYGAQSCRRCERMRRPDDSTVGYSTVNIHQVMESLTGSSPAWTSPEGVYSMLAKLIFGAHDCCRRAVVAVAVL